MTESSYEIHVKLKVYHFVIERGPYFNGNNRANVFAEKKKNKAFGGEYFVDSIMQKTFKLIISSL